LSLSQPTAVRPEVYVKLGYLCGESEKQRTGEREREREGETKREREREMVTWDRAEGRGTVAVDSVSDRTTPQLLVEKA
jgi:hypothetical protein